MVIANYTLTDYYQLEVASPDFSGSYKGLDNFTESDFPDAERRFAFTRLFLQSMDIPENSYVGKRILTLAAKEPKNAGPLKNILSVFPYAIAGENAEIPPQLHRAPLPTNLMEEAPTSRSTLWVSVPQLAEGDGYRALIQRGTVNGYPITQHTIQHLHHKERTFWVRQTDVPSDKLNGGKFIPWYTLFDVVAIGPHHNLSLNNWEVIKNPSETPLSHNET